MKSTVEKRERSTPPSGAGAGTGTGTGTGTESYAGLSTQLGHQLFESFRRLRKLPWLSFQNHGTKASGMQVLFCLDHGSREGSTDTDVGMMISEIGQRLRVTSPTVTQMVKELEATGHVERIVDTRDRRVIRVLLTDRGRATLQEGRMAVRKVFAGLVDHLGEEESETLIRLLHKVLSFQGIVAGAVGTTMESITGTTNDASPSVNDAVPFHSEGGERL